MREHVEAFACLYEEMPDQIIERVGRQGPSAGLVSADHVLLPPMNGELYKVRVSVLLVMRVPAV